MPMSTYKLQKYKCWKLVGSYSTHGKESCACHGCIHCIVFQAWNVPAQQRNQTKCLCSCFGILSLCRRQESISISSLGCEKWTRSKFKYHQFMWSRIFTLLRYKPKLKSTIYHKHWQWRNDEYDSTESYVESRESWYFFLRWLIKYELWWIIG